MKARFEVKKSFLLSLILMPFFFAGFFLPVSGAEESVPIQAPALSGEARVSVTPLEFSLSGSEWLESEPGTIFSTGTHAPDFTLPVLKGDPVPIRYPRWAVRQGWEGTLVIALEILTDGTVGHWQVMRSTGHSLLDEAAARAVLQWRFLPATEHGEAVAMCVQLPIQFRLKPH